MGDFSEWEKLEMAAIKEEIEISGVSNIAEWRDVEVNIAITGYSGSGKSSFINAIRGLNDCDEGAAPVDVAMCTREPTPYDHPTNPNIKFWDMPGLGTPNHPDMETYCKKLQLENYHTYLIFTAARFDLELAKKIRSTGKKVFFIHTNIDNSVRAESRKRSFDEEALLTKIRRNCLESLGDLLTDEQDIFLISNHHPGKWEFARLTMAILDAVTGYHKENMTLLLRKVVANFLFQRKVKILRGRIWKVALTSGAAAHIPLPGLSFAVDRVLILRELSLYKTQLGLPKIGSDEFAKLHLATKEKVLTTEAQLTAFLAPNSPGAAVSGFTRYIPVVGPAIASSVSFGATYYALSNLLTKVEEAAKIVLKEVAEKTAADF